MDKKMTCGILVTVIGLVYSVSCLAYAGWMTNTYVNLDGLFDTEAGRFMILPFVISLLVMLAGLAFCFWCAFRKEN